MQVINVVYPWKEQVIYVTCGGVFPAFMFAQNTAETTPVKTYQCVHKKDEIGLKLH